MTIRLRLTLLFSVLVSVLLCGFAGVIYVLLSVERAKDFDTLLASRALLAGIVVLEKNELDSATHLASVLRFERSALPEEHISVYNTDNEILFNSDSLLQNPHRISLQDDANALKTARQGTSAYLSHKTSDGLQLSPNQDMMSSSSLLPLQVQLRSLYLPYDDENRRYVVVIRAFDRDGAQTQSDTVWVLVVAVTSSLVIVALAGWFFAGRMLAPVEGMTRLAEDISGNDLSKRLPKRLPEGNGRDELAHLAKAFNSMFVRLEKAFTAQKQFVAHASHEIRTPLTSMIGEIGVTLSQPRTEDEYRETLDSVLAGALQMRQMASDLLQLVRVESGVAAQDVVPCAMDEIVLAAVEQCQQKYPERRVITEIVLDAQDYPDTLYLVRGNAEILRLIVVNILDNAVKYSLPETSVELTLRKEDTDCVIEISDKGRGISVEEQDSVFAPFFRSDRTREIAGTGVGLAFVSEAVRLHQGFVRLKSAEEQGTAVTVILPMLPASTSNMPY